MRVAMLSNGGTTWIRWGGGEGQMWIFVKLQSRESANGLEESDANGDEC